MELPEETTHDNVRRQYIRLVKKYHPDTNGDDPIAREKFTAVDEVLKLFTRNAPNFLLNLKLYFLQK